MAIDGDTDLRLVVLVLFRAAVPLELRDSRDSQHPQPWRKRMSQDLQAEIDLLMDRIRGRVQEISPLAMAQLHRVRSSNGDHQDRLRGWFVDLARGDEQLTDLCVHLEVLSCMAEGRL